MTHRNHSYLSMFEKALFLRILMFLSVLLVFVPYLSYAADNVPVEGKDYIVIAEPQTYSPVAGKIEVVEVFGYTCGHCAHFEPIFSRWQQKQANDVQIHLVPAPFSSYWIPYARVFFTNQKLGVLDKTHAATFQAIHETHALPVQNVSTTELATFFSGLGVNAEQFSNTIRSAEVDQKVEKARQFLIKTEVDGTPTLIINGKYLVASGPQGFDALLKTADYLINRERQRSK